MEEYIAGLIKKGVDRGLIEYVMAHCYYDEGGNTTNAKMLLDYLAADDLKYFWDLVDTLQVRGYWEEDENKLSEAEEAEINAAVDAVMALDGLPREMDVPVQYLNTTLIMRKLFYSNDDDLADLLPGAAVELEIESQEKEKWLVYLQTESILNVDKRLDTFDFAILDAVYTLYCNGINVFPTKWIDMLLTGNNKRNSTPKSIARIDQAIDKLALTYVKCTIGADERRRTPLLSVHRFGHTQGRVYYLSDINDLYTYASDVHQIANTPAEYFDTSELPKEFAFKDTEDAIVIKRRVIARVMRILNISDKKSHIANWNRISLIQKKKADRGLFPELGLMPNLEGLNDAEAAKRQKQWRTKQKPMYIQVVKGTLENLKRRYVILDYEEHRDNDSKNPKDPVTGFDVICFTKTEKAALVKLRNEQKPQYVQNLLTKRQNAQK